MHLQSTRGFPRLTRLQQAPALTLTVGVVAVLPFSSVIFLLLAVCALSSYTQYNAVVRQGLERQSSNATVVPAQLFPDAERNRHAAMLSMMGTVSLDNLRLGMMNRDFNESGKVIQPAM